MKIPTLLLLLTISQVVCVSYTFYGYGGRGGREIEFKDDGIRYAVAGEHLGEVGYI
jgi:hypothetical protein